MSSSTKLTSTPAKFRPLRAIGVFAVLFVVAVPWWWNWFPELGRSLVFGAPLWAVTAVLGSFAISCVAAWSLQRAWDSSDAEEV